MYRRRGDKSTCADRTSGGIIKAMHAARVLIVDDDLQFASSLARLLETVGVESDLSRTKTEAFNALLYSPFDAILLDLDLGKESGLDILRELNNSGSALPIITMTANGSIETVAEAMHLNAFDYITKPFLLTEIREIITRAIESSRQKNAPTRDTTGRTIPVIGQSPATIEIYKAIAQVAPVDCSVLITGEDGTGKDQVAQSIHDHSGRSKYSMVTWNCRAIDDHTSIEDIFLGKGAILEQAAGGSIFLDDLHLLNPKHQIALLRLLSATKEDAPGRPRMIAGSSQQADKILASSFHRDLLYRLSAVHIHIPALRERTEDIPLLANHYVRKFSRRQKKQVTLPAETAEWMKTLSWNGNITELQNAVERAVTFNTNGKIDKEDFIRFGLHSSKQATDPLMSEIEAAGLAVQKALDLFRSKTSVEEVAPALEAVEMLLKKMRDSR